MKQTTKMSRAVGQLEKIYSHLNLDFFEGQLPVPIITVQSKPGTYGHCSVAKVWQRPDGSTYELRNRYALCRCGASRNKPFCDAMHVSIGFSDGLD